MKAKNILKLKERLENATEEHEYHDKGMNSKSVRFDVWEEAVFLSYGNGEKEFTISLEEAKRLKNLLNKLI